MTYYPCFINMSVNCDLPDYVDVNVTHQSCVHVSHMQLESE